MFKTNGVVSYRTYFSNIMYVKAPPFFAEKMQVAFFFGKKKNAVVDFVKTVKLDGSLTNNLFKLTML